MSEDPERTFQLRILLQLQPAVQPRRLRLIRRVSQDMGRQDRWEGLIYGGIHLRIDFKD